MCGLLMFSFEGLSNWLVIAKRSGKAQDQRHCPGFAERCVCVCTRTFCTLSWAVHVSALAFTSCLSRLSLSQGENSLQACSECVRSMFVVFWFPGRNRSELVKVFLPWSILYLSLSSKAWLVCCQSSCCPLLQAAATKASALSVFSQYSTFGTGWVLG